MSLAYGGLIPLVSISSLFGVIAVAIIYGILGGLNFNDIYGKIVITNNHPNLQWPIDNICLEGEGCLIDYNRTNCTALEEVCPHPLADTTQIALETSIIETFQSNVSYLLSNNASFVFATTGRHCWDLNGDLICNPEEDINGDGNCTAADCTGLHCWDLNGDRLCNAEEDINGDGNCTAADCTGIAAHQCWDLNENNICDAEEDVNGDGNCTIHDCGGLNCWDLNGNGFCDPLEDINGDGNCTAADCAGTDCWDLNSNGNCDLGTEDINGDGFCTHEDCLGADCWDLNENRICDLGSEDINGDGFCTVADCTGRHCWDLNGNGFCDLGSEDINGDLSCTAADCQGAVGFNATGSGLVVGGSFAGSHAFTPAEDNHILIYTGAGPATFTLGAGLGINYQVNVYKLGIGELTIASSGGATFETIVEMPIIDVNQMVTITPVGVDDYLVSTFYNDAHYPYQPIENVGVGLTLDNADNNKLLRIELTTLTTPTITINTGLIKGFSCRMIMDGVLNERYGNLVFAGTAAIRVPGVIVAAIPHEIIEITNIGLDEYVVTQISSVTRWPVVSVTNLAIVFLFPSYSGEIVHINTLGSSVNAIVSLGFRPGTVVRVWYTGDIDITFTPVAGVTIVTDLTFPTATSDQMFELTTVSIAPPTVFISTTNALGLQGATGNQGLPGDGVNVQAMAPCTCTPAGTCTDAELWVVREPSVTALAITAGSYICDKTEGKWIEANRRNTHQIAQFSLPLYECDLTDGLFGLDYYMTPDCSFIHTDLYATHTIKLDYEAIMSEFTVALPLQPSLAYCRRFELRMREVADVNVLPGSDPTVGATIVIGEFNMIATVRDTVQTPPIGYIPAGLYKVYMVPHIIECNPLVKPIQGATLEMHYRYTIDG